jgi:hypothetical protein
MWRDPEGVSLGRVHVWATGSCAISALVGPFDRKWRHQTSPACATGSALCVLSRTSASYLSFSIPFTGYLPLSNHFISAFNNYTKVCCFRICCVVLQVVYHVRVLTVGVLDNLRVKWMKWYIWSPNRRSPGHEILGLGPKLVGFWGILVIFSEIF